MRPCLSLSTNLVLFWIILRDAFRMICSSLLQEFDLLLEGFGGHPLLDHAYELTRAHPARWTSDDIGCTTAMQWMKGPRLDSWYMRAMWPRTTFALLVSCPTVRFRYMLWMTCRPVSSSKMLFVKLCAISKNAVGHVRGRRAVDVSVENSLYTCQPLNKLALVPSTLAGA
jgi:hypothetical protein